MLVQRNTIICWALGGVLIVVVGLLVDHPLQAQISLLDGEVRQRLGWLSKAGNSKWYLIPLAIVLPILVWGRHRVSTSRPAWCLTWLIWTALFLFLAITSSGLLAALLKYAIGRGRPTTLEDYGPFDWAPFSFDSDFAAFPSGHADTLLVLATALGFLVPALRPLWFGVAIWLALTRVFVGAHFLSDVLAGGALGVVTTYGWRQVFAARRVLFITRPNETAAMCRGMALWRWAARWLASELAWPRLHRLGLSVWLHPRLCRLVFQTSQWLGAKVTGFAPVRPLHFAGAVSQRVGGANLVAIGGSNPACLDQELSSLWQRLPRNRGRPFVSIVIAIRDAAANITPLLAEIEAVLDHLLPYEVICVDDGCITPIAEVLAAELAARPHLRCLRHAQSYGESAALRTGILAAHGDYIATLNDDGQDDPADLPRLLAILCALEAPRSLAMVSGRGVSRQDNLAERISSSLARGIWDALLGDGTSNAGCEIKVFQRDAYLMLPYFDHMHRFMPALMQREGFMVRTVDVRHRSPRGGRSSYGALGLAWADWPDLLGVLWLIHRRHRAPVVEELS